MKSRNSLKTIFPVSVLLFILVLCTSFFFYMPVERISMDLVSKDLQDGKSITTRAEVFYRISGGLLVTHITSPIEYLVITNEKGEIKMYDVKANSVSQMQASDFSSENSFIHDFLSGNTNDMGLRRLGFQLKNSSVEEDMVITDWIPPLEINSPINHIELVHENYSPVYMAFYGKKDKLISKIYYSNYQKTGDLNIPLVITEFQYHPNGDSTITKRVYSNIKLNEQVNEKWLNYKIPENAKIVK